MFGNQEPRPAVLGNNGYIIWPNSGFVPYQIIPTSKRWSFAVAGGDATVSAVRASEVFMTSDSMKDVFCLMKEYDYTIKPGGEPHLANLLNARPLPGYPCSMKDIGIIVSWLAEELSGYYPSRDGHLPVAIDILNMQSYEDI